MLKEALSRMAQVFSPTVLMQGQEYQQQGYVLTIRLSDGLLKARVKGNSSRIYDVHFDLKTWPSIKAHCSCSYQLNCKHAAACLFALQVRENYEIPAPVSEKAKPNLNAWLDALREQVSETTKPNTNQKLVYLLELQLGEHEHRILIRLALMKQLKKGGFGKKIGINSLTKSRWQHFTSIDEEIISSLKEKCVIQDWFDYLPIRNSELLEKIIATGRAYWDIEEETPIALGEHYEANLRWQLAKNGTQHLALVAKDKFVSPLLLDKCWYYSKEENWMGLLNTAYTPRQLRMLCAMAPIELEQVPVVAKNLALTYPELPMPNPYEQRVEHRVRPVPIVCFDQLRLEKEQRALFVLAVFFDYEGIIIGKNEEKTRFYRGKEDVLLEMPRDLAYEKEKMGEINQIIAIRSPNFAEKLAINGDVHDKWVLVHYQDEENLPRLHSQVIPLLTRKGWRIELKHPVYNELVDGDELEWFSFLEESGNDFFSYQLGILIDGKPVSIVPLVAELITRIGRDNLDCLPDNERVKLPFSEGKVLYVSLGRIKPLLRFLLQYGLRHVRSSQPLQISRYQLMLMQETELALAAIKARWHGNDKLRKQLNQLAGLVELPHIPAPQGLKAMLRDYQQQGLNWLQFLRASQFNGVLADDMGLGKTVQTLTHLQVEKEQGRLNRACLIVAPTSLVGNWFVEAQRFTPELKVLIFHGADRHNDNFDDYDLIISTYGLIQRDKIRFIDYSFYYFILDEAQLIKNARTKTTQIIQQIQARHRLCLSGTPLENHLGELWSLFHFLMPGFLGDAKQFRQFFRTPIEKLNDPEKRMMLAKRIQPFLLRRSKNQVLQELPDKTEMVHFIELVGSQRDLYEAIRLSMEKKVRDAIDQQGLGKSHIVLLDALLKLRQVCCDPRLLSLPEAKIAHGTSAKLDALMGLLENLIEEGRRVLVFSQFTSMLQLIEEELIVRNYPYLKLTGQTQNRLELVNKFQEGAIPIFLISLKAGGMGLNLTRADTVIHYDPWWNPAVEEQATDRSHRIGQENPVFVYKLITSGTVEEAIMMMQQKKRQLFEGILADKASGLLSLTKNDVEQFFRPLIET